MEPVLPDGLVAKGQLALKTTGICVRLERRITASGPEHSNISASGWRSFSGAHYLA
jgi:hypothetical protein